MYQPVTWPFLQRGPSNRRPPQIPTGHTETFFVPRIWGQGREGREGGRVEEGRGVRKGWREGGKRGRKGKEGGKREGGREEEREEGKEGGKR